MNPPTPENVGIFAPNQNTMAPAKTWNFWDRLRCRIYPPKYNEPEWPEAISLDGDGLVIRTDVHFSFLDRVRILLSGKAHVCSRTTTERVIGKHKAAVAVFPVWRFLLMATALLCAGNLKAQIPNATWFDTALTNLPVSVTNCVFAPYFTYAPEYKPHKYGGGGLFGYNFVQGTAGAVGGQIALDWLGHLSLATGDLTAQTPFHLDSLFTPLTKLAWTTNLMIVPEVRAGITTAYSGGGHFNGTASGDVGIGGALQYKHFDAGYDYGHWIGSAPYDVPRNHFFFAYRMAF